MAATLTVGPTGRSTWTVAPGSSERAFRKARRHSRLVRILRFSLPALILAATAGISITTYLNRLLAPLPVKIDTLVVSGSKVTMDHPHLTGFTRDERAYEVRADAAVQDLTKPNMIELKNIDAKVQMQDNSSVKLTAPVGLYDSKKETLKLDHDILITSTRGYQGRLKEAWVDIRKGQVNSNLPVEMKMLQGTLNANRLAIMDSGDLVLFDRSVHMVMMLNKGEVEQKVASDAPDEPATAEAPRNDPLRTVLTPLPRTDPRRFGSFASAPQNWVWLRLPPNDPRHSNALTTGSIR
jgi:lipopolysaccharide export system protein LptC